MRSESQLVAKRRVGGELAAASSSRPVASRCHQRAADALPPRLSLHEPALEERDRSRRAAFGVVAKTDLAESDGFAVRRSRDEAGAPFGVQQFARFVQEVGAAARGPQLGAQRGPGFDIVASHAGNERAGLSHGASVPATRSQKNRVTGTDSDTEPVAEPRSVACATRATVTVDGAIGGVDSVVRSPNARPPVFMSIEPAWHQSR
jgi:hypothetical protein